MFSLSVSLLLFSFTTDDRLNLGGILAARYQRLTSYIPRISLVQRSRAIDVTGGKTRFRHIGGNGGIIEDFQGIKSWSSTHGGI